MWWATDKKNTALRNLACAMYMFYYRNQNSRKQNPNLSNHLSYLWAFGLQWSLLGMIYSNKSQLMWGVPFRNGSSWKFTLSNSLGSGSQAAVLPADVAQIQNHEYSCTFWMASFRRRKKTNLKTILCVLTHSCFCVFFNQAEHWVYTLALQGLSTSPHCLDS